MSEDTLDHRTVERIRMLADRGYQLLIGCPPEGEAQYYVAFRKRDDETEDFHFPNESFSRGSDIQSTIRLAYNRITDGMSPTGEAANIVDSIYDAAKDYFLRDENKK